LGRAALVALPVIFFSAAAAVEDLLAVGGPVGGVWLCHFGIAVKNSRLAAVQPDDP
jgi:hypothetical protein